jgi:adenylate kinase
MTAAQKLAKENFKKAIAYRKISGCTLKEAFAKIYNKKTAPIKKAASKVKKLVKKAKDAYYEGYNEAARKSNPLMVKKRKVGAVAKKKAVKKAAPKKVAKKAAPKKHTKYGKVKAHVRRVAGMKKPESVHKDTKSHNVNIRVVSGIGKNIKIGSMPVYRDKDAAREIQLYADNDSQLYYQRRKPILQNLSKKYLKGQYDIDKAAKLWRYYIDAALQKYHKEFGGRGSWSNLLSVPDRNLLAIEYAKATKDEFDLGNTY